MGAATICYSHLHMVEYDFVVLESCYAILKDAVKGAFAKYRVPSPFAKSMAPVAEYMSGYKEENMEPRNLIELINCPLLVMAGEDERIVKKSSTIDLFKRNKAPFSKLHIFSKAEHENFSVKYKEEYVSVLEEFIDLVELEAQVLS